MHLPQVNVSRVNTALVYCSPAALANQRLLTRDLTVRKKTPLDISLRELCQNPIVLERENIKTLAENVIILTFSLSKTKFSQ